ncbi:MAG: ExbD/TolR family protein [Verrucomicrobiales bacterium]
MASQKLAAAAAGQEEDLKLDMSPMIDLVFLLLIFFMVNSTLIIVRIDKEVKIPVAEEAKVAKDSTGRIVLNIRETGVVYDVNKNLLEDDASVTRYVRDMKSLHNMAGIKSRLHVRADKEVATREIKKTVQAAAAAGVIDVIFSSYVTDK